MKSKHLLLTLLLALFVPWAANAQETVTIGEGTVTSNTNPIGTYYNYSITEQLYTAEEIGTAGTISSISFYYMGNAAKELPITVYMKHVDEENLASAGISLADADEVFSGTLSVTTTAGWVTINLDTPFAYDGTSNLLIGCIKDYLYYFSGQSWQGTATTTTMARYTQSDSAGPYTTSTVPGSAQTNRPNIQIEITPSSGPSCAKPNGLAVAASGTDATFTWNGEADEFDVAHSMDASADPNNCIVGQASTTSYQFTNLELGDHYVWVRANCGSNGYSDWSAKKSFHIGYCVPAPSSVDNNGISNVTFGIGENVVNNDTPKATYADYHNLVGAVYAGVEATIAITFKTGYTYNTFVWVDLDNNLSFDADEVVCYGESTNANPTTLTLNFTIPAEQTMGDFGLRIGSADSGLGSDPTAADPCYTGSYGCFQDYTLRVLETPSCLPPTGLAVSDVTAHEANLTWTENGEATAWIVEFDTDPEFTSVLIENVEDEPSLHFQGLAAETTYYVRVKAVCSPGNESDYSSNTSFTTTIACPVPTVAVGSITAFTAEVSCTNTAAEYFNVMLGEEVVAENVAMPYTLTELTDNTSYTVKVQAICDGEDGESAWSSGTSFMTAEICPEGMVCIGQGTATSNYVPAHNYYKYSLTEQIYTAAEIGMAGQISSIEFYKASTTAMNVNLDIYMVSTTKDEFTGTSDWIQVTAGDLVYSGTVTFTDNDWTNIELQTPFDYDGTSNLCIVVDNNTGDYVSSTPFRVFTAAKNQALYYQSDSNNLDPTTSLTTSGNRMTSKNRIRIAIGEPPACPKPTHVEVAYITNDAATVLWEGTSTTYEVQYRTAETSQLVYPEGSYFDDFENGLANWTLIDADGDGFNWALASETFSGFTPHGGSDMVVSASYDSQASSALTPDNYLVSPQVELGQTLTFWACGQDNQYPAEHFGVAVSTTVNDDPAAFTTVQEWTMTAKSMGGKTANTRSGNRDMGTWYQYTVDLSAYSGNGYIAIRHFDCTDMFFLDVDDFQYGEAPETIITPAGDWMTVETENLAAELTGLAVGTTYEYQVRGYCDADSTYSEWTSMATFTTLDVCATPENLVIVPGATSATLTWEGVQEQYVLLWVDAADYNSGTYTIQDAEVTGTYFEMTGLESGHEYYVDVYGVCSDTQYSSYLAGSFTTALLWTDPETWGYNPGDEYPGESSAVPVTIPDNMVVVIPENTMIEVNTIDMGANALVIIEEGSELIYEGAAADDGINVTMSMTITPSGAKSGTDYRLIASPIYQTIGVVDCGLTENYYGMDLYSFDASYPGAEWRNYKTNDNFDNLEIGKGYLYYNSESVFVTFYGQTVPSNVIYPITLTYADNAQDDTWKGLNLVGNPFTCKAVPSKPFFVLNADGSEIVTTASTEAYVAPMKGFFVVANNDSDVCNVTKYTGSTKSALNMTVNQNDDLVDVAVVNFSKGENLRKVQLNPNHTKIYMPVEGNDYAVANAESNAGEMPVNFKAEYNGSYTLNFGIDNVNFNYLHLIDNMTGADVDLLATPYYTFNANSTDYASRFKLVYATGDNSNDDNFAFFNNGNIIINNDGEAMLQVVDVMGRILKSESINGSTSVNLNVAPGVYMLRLINGNDMKVQKMIVK